LEHFAYRAMHVSGKGNDEFVVFCIKVDSEWRDIVDQIMPNADWQQYRDRGEEPVARGWAYFSLCAIVAMRMPDLVGVLMEKPAEGMAKCIALDEGGCTVYEIKPAEQPEQGVPS